MLAVLVRLPSSLLCCQHTAVQDVFVPMPLLTHLTIDQQLTGQSAHTLAAARLKMLDRLDVRTDLSHAWFLQSCKQLRTLTLLSASIKGVSNVGQLTGLTQLELRSVFPGQQLFSAAEQSELGSALAALSNLQNLLISNAPFGPVTQVLFQLTGLTQLVLSHQGLVHNPGPHVLPSCVKLTFWENIEVQHLVSIDAPQLLDLYVSLAVKPSDLDALRRLCRGVLRACSSLSIHLNKAWSKEDTVALMAVLSKDWQPSAEALQPVRCSYMGLQESRTLALPRKWHLELWHTHCSCQCLKLLPKGLSSLHLGWVPCIYATHLCSPPGTDLLVPPVTHHKYAPGLLMPHPCMRFHHRRCTLDPDSLDPLAQLASLRELFLPLYTGLTVAALEGLMSTAVQGCLLRITVAFKHVSSPIEDYAGMRQRVVAQRGSRDTPVLRIW
jgi:hypothetical protein